MTDIARRPELLARGAMLATATAAKSGSTVTVTVNDTVVTVQCARDLTVATGDVVLLNRFGAQWVAVCRMYAAATTPEADPVVAAPIPKPTSTSGSLVVSPVQTLSWRTVFGGWRDDGDEVYQGEYGGWGNNTGCVFYGSKPKSLAGSTVTDAKLRVKRLSAGTYAAQVSTMRLMTNATKPAGYPTLTSTTTGPSLAVGASTTDFDVPTSWVQAMVDGTAGGLAFYEADGSPYIKFAGRAAWSSAFTLTIYWRRG